MASATASTADAAGGEYTRVRMRLTGRLTPIRRRQLSIASNSNSSDGTSDSTDSRGEREAPEEEEAELRGLLDAAVVRATEARYALRRSATWARLLELLPLLAEAQSLLLADERSRCRAVEERRGRASRVRFQCYDLSAVEPPRPTAAACTAEHDTLLRVCTQLVAGQRAMLDAAAPPDIQLALGSLVDALRAEAAEQHLPRTKRAATWCADAFDALQTEGASADAQSTRPSLCELRPVFFWRRSERGRAGCSNPLAACARSAGILVLEARLSEILGSLLRFHLHAIFDRPSRSALRAAERGEAARELLANDAARDSRGASLRFYVPRAGAGLDAGCAGLGPAWGGEGEGSPPTAMDGAEGCRGRGSSLTAELRKELASLELVQLPLNGEMGPLGQRNYGSLGALVRDQPRRLLLFGCSLTDSR